MVQSRCLRSAVLAGAFALAAVVVMTPGHAPAQDDGTVENSNSIWDIERRIWNGVVRGFGLRTGDEPVINYRERPPLVLPPSRDLPPPQAKATPKDPAWPKDPDQARRKARVDAKRTVGNDTSRVIDRQSGPITPDQLDVPGGKPSTASGPPPTQTAADGRNLNPSELGYFGQLFSLRAWGFGAYQNEVGTFTSEPPRTALTAPPTGYQTPSPEHPYGTTKRIERSKTQQFDPAGRM